MFPRRNHAHDQDPGPWQAGGLGLLGGSSGGALGTLRVISTRCEPGERKAPFRDRLAEAIAFPHPDERRELRDLAVKSRGKRANLTGTDEDRLVALFLKIRRAPDGTGGPAGASGYHTIISEVSEV